MAQSSQNEAPSSRTRESREEILRAAAELFMQFGYAATSIDAVAESLGATKGHIYHYYRSKADLFFDIQTAAMTRLTEEVEAIARGAGTVLERLAAMAVRHMQILLTELPMQKVAVQGLERHLFTTPTAARQLRAVVKLRDGYEQMFAEVIAQGVDEGVILDLPPQLLTKPFFGAMNWATVWFSQRRLQNAQDTEEIARLLASCALRGILKDAHHEFAKALPLLQDGMG